MVWEANIGLEVHIQLKTKSKLFSGTSTNYGAFPNTQISKIDLAYPGVLPVLNAEAVKMAVKFGLSINAEISKTSVFERKNYFYPDLPKGYQITQNEAPLIKNGFITIHLSEKESRKITIKRAHLEEDAAKSVHKNFTKQTGIDFNRVGVPLLEIVTAPDLHSAKEAAAYLRTLQILVRYLGISNANMQEGSFRCDANISVRLKDQKTLGVRTEVKNSNSFRFIERAIDYEIKRQIKILESGGRVIQETRLYDEINTKTRAMRFKEEAEDYRYFYEPDLLPLKLTDEFIKQIATELPELPHEKLQRLQQDYALNFYDANILSSDLNTANYFEEVVNTKVSPKLAANWIISELASKLHSNNVEIKQSPITSKQLGELLKCIEEQIISGKIAKEVFAALWNKEGNVDDIIANKGLRQIIDSEVLEKIITAIIADYPGHSLEYRNGKNSLLDFFVGKVMDKTRGKANPWQVNNLLKEKLKS